MMFMCGSVVCGFGCIGAPFVRGVTRRGVGWAVGVRGNCTTRRFDTPATRRWEASCSAKPPIGSTALTSSHPSSHLVSPKARGERRADLRNKLIGVVQIVPSDADNVPALGFKVALAFALAGE